MEMNEQTRWKPQLPAETGCCGCNKKPAYVCMRCSRLFCANHLMLVEWAADGVKAADDEPGMLQPSGMFNKSNRELLCTQCAVKVMNY